MIEYVLRFLDPNGLWIKIWVEVENELCVDSIVRLEERLSATFMYKE